MLPSESITSMFTRMTTIKNSLDTLGIIYTNVEIISRIFRSLQKLGKQK
jgi:predicted helicase